MSMTSGFANSVAALIFNATAIADLAENDTSGPLTNLYNSLHTASPGAAGTQTTSEIAYTGYARVATARTSGGWSCSAGVVTPVANIDFPVGSGGSGTATHWGIGTLASGAGVLYLYGPITPNIVCGNGIIPRLTTASSITWS